jgi:hypothetical protein
MMAVRLPDRKGLGGLYPKGNWAIIPIPEKQRLGSLFGIFCEVYGCRWIEV